VLTVVLRNLFANAVTYAPAGGRVWCEIAARDGRCVLSVRNTNDSLTDKDLPLLTEPFWRKDAARGATCNANTGLGLSLVAAYADLLHVRFTTALPTPQTFAATLDIPLATDAKPAATRAQKPKAELADAVAANMIAP
jgi:K+-sensing histidine kinase KdpD